MSARFLGVVGRKSGEVASRDTMSINIALSVRTPSIRALSFIHAPNRVNLWNLMECLPAVHCKLSISLFSC